MALSFTNNNRRSRKFFFDNKTGTQYVNDTATNDQTNSDNIVRTVGSSSGSGVSVRAAGQDTNIKLTLSPKGSGDLEFLGTGKFVLNNSSYTGNIQLVEDDILVNPGTNGGDLTFGGGAFTFAAGTYNTSLTVATATADRTITFPDATGTAVLADATQTLTNKTLGATSASGNITPTVDNTYDLGSTSYRWRDVYIGPGSLYVNNKQVLSDESGTITVQTSDNQNLTVKTTGTGVTTVSSATQVALTATSSGDITLTTSSGNIELKGTVEVLTGKKITDSAGSQVAFGNSIYLDNGSNLIFEGGTDDTYETTIQVADPTADRTITLPDATGTVALTSDITLSTLGVTATAGELNTLDGITATTAELNYTDGVTSAIQTQLDAKLASASYTASDVLTKIKTVDGTGSGLDADLLDGISSASFLRSDANDIITGDNRSLSFGTPGAGSTTGARFLSIEGNSDTSGEGSGRIFFAEHNSTTASMDNYGFSIGYRGGDTSIVGASGNTWTGLSAIGNGEWGMWGHDNSATGSLIAHGPRSGSYADFTNLLISGNQVWHAGNDGAGSGLDADLLDGNEATAFALLSGATFTGAVSGTSLTLSGDLTVNGTTTTLNTTNTVVSDNLIELNNGVASNANDSGIVIERGSTGDNAFIGWDESADTFILGTTTATGASTGDLTITVAPLKTGALGVTGNITASGTVHGSQGFTYNPTEGGTTLSRYWMLFDQTNNASYPYLTNRTPNGDVVIKSGTTAGGAEIERIRFNGGDGTQDIVISNATLKSDTNVYWHAGNDGTGSGLDADLLDGQHASAFAQSWRALDSTGNSYGYVKIASLTELQQSSRFLIQLAGTSGSYSDGTHSSYGVIVGQLNNDNNADLTYYNHSHTTEVVSAVYHVDVSSSAVDVYAQVGAWAELTAIGSISDGILTPASSYSTSTPSGLVAADEYKVFNSGNDGSGSGLDADLLDGNQATAFATAAQGATADSALQNVVEDTTPQLGGSLDVNGQEITGAIDLHSTGDIIAELGDAAGTNKVSIKDSGGTEVVSINSKGNIAATNYILPDSFSLHIGDLAAGELLLNMFGEYSDHYTGATVDTVEEDTGSGLASVTITDAMRDLFSGFPGTSGYTLGTSVTSIRITFQTELNWPSGGYLLFSQDWQPGGPKTFTITKLERDSTSAFSAPTTLLSNVSMDAEYYNFKKVNDHSGDRWYRLELDISGRSDNIRFTNFRHFTTRLQWGRYKGLPFTWDYNSLNFKSAAFDNVGNVGIGTDAVPHGGIGAAKLAIEGTTNSVSGPHVQYTVSTDDYPVFQQLNWSHDNIALSFDSYYDLTAGGWKSSDAGSNFSIYKLSDKLTIKYDSGVAAGNTVTWNTGFVLDTSGNVGIGTTSPLAKLDVRGGDVLIKGQSSSFDFLPIQPGTSSGTYSLTVNHHLDAVIERDWNVNNTTKLPFTITLMGCQIDGNFFVTFTISGLYRYNPSTGVYSLENVRTSINEQYTYHSFSNVVVTAGASKNQIDIDFDYSGAYNLTITCFITVDSTSLSYHQTNIQTDKDGAVKIGDSLSSTTASGITPHFSISGDRTRNAWGLTGVQFDSDAATFTDNSTAASGTASTAVFNSFDIPTLAATNASVTTTDAATVYIAGAPAAGTNQTITNPYALWVDAGNVKFDGDLDVAGNIAVSGTEGIVIPSGTTAQRPVSPATGTMRFNTTTSRFEGYNGTAWVPIDTLYS